MWWVGGDADHLRRPTTSTTNSVYGRVRLPFWFCVCGFFCIVDVACPIRGTNAIIDGLIVLGARMMRAHACIMTD